VRRLRTLFGPDRFGTSLWLWLPLAIAAVDLAVLVGQARGLVSALYLNADSASAPVIGSYIDSVSPDRVVTLGEYPWYEPVWFMQLTDWLPAHRQLWEAAPFLFSAAGIALIVWTAKRAWGPWAAAMTGALLVFTSEDMRRVLFTLNTHGASLVHGAVLGATLVYLNQRWSRLSKPAVVLLGLAVAAFTAAGITDRLAIATGLVPFVAAALVGWLRTGQLQQRGIAIFALLVTAASAAGERVVVAVMRNMDVFNSGYHLRFVRPRRLGENVELLITAFSSLGGGTFFGSLVGREALFALAAGGLTLLAAGLVSRWLLRGAPKLIDRAPSTTPAATAQEAYLVFWGLTFVSTIGAFVVSSAPLDIAGDRYLPSAFVAVAALLPALTRDARARALLVVGASLFGLLALRTHVYHSPAAPKPEFPRFVFAKVAKYAEAHRLRYGYGAYAVSAPLTWTSNKRVQVFPVKGCPHVRKLCPAPVHSISSWYAPRPRTPTFLVAVRTRSGYYWPGPAQTAVSGKPLTVVNFGRVTVYVYDHDLAADMG
jgi:hypothetical protein